MKTDDPVRSQHARIYKDSRPRILLGGARTRILDPVGRTQDIGPKNLLGGPRTNNPWSHDDPEF